MSHLLFGVQLSTGRPLSLSVLSDGENNPAHARIQTFVSQPVACPY